MKYVISTLETPSQPIAEIIISIIHASSSSFHLVCYFFAHVILQTHKIRAC